MKAYQIVAELRSSNNLPRGVQELHHAAADKIEQLLAQLAAAQNEASRLRYPDTSGQ